MSDFTLPHIGAEAALRLAASGDAVLIDLRKPQATAASGQLVRGAERRDPFAFSHDDHWYTHDTRLVAVDRRARVRGWYHHEDDRDALIERMRFLATDVP